MVRYSDKHFDGLTNDVMTLTYVIIGVCWVYFTTQTPGMFWQFIYNVMGVIVGVWAVSSATPYLIRGVQVNRKNALKVQEQLWQLTIHIAMTWLNWGCWEFVYNKALLFSNTPLLVDVNIKAVYVVQMSVWLVTAARHRFVATRAKDYYLMFAHHVVTLLLLILSYGAASNALVPYRSIWSLRIGATVLLLHDISDIVVDILRISHDLSIEGKSGWYLAEISFFTNLLTWAYFRLYQFPILIHYLRTTGITKLFLAYPYSSVMLGIEMLIILFCMHCYWYYLFGRILYKFITNGNAAHDAGREYEGDSD